MFFYDVSQFVHLGDIVEETKFFIPGRKNVSKKIQKYFCCGSNDAHMTNYAWKILCTRSINYSPVPLVKQKTSDSFEPRSRPTAANSYYVKYWVDKQVTYINLRA